MKVFEYIKSLAELLLYVSMEAVYVCQQMHVVGAVKKKSSLCSSYSHFLLNINTSQLVGQT